MNPALRVLESAVHFMVFAAVWLFIALFWPFLFGPWRRSSRRRRERLDYWVD